jgi:hypothetical protein
VFAIVGLFQLVYAGRIYPGVTALGLRLGGLSEDQAAERLADRTAELTHKEVVLRLGDERWRSSTADLGVRLDPAPLAASAFAIGREGSPRARLVAQVGALFGGAEVAWAPSSPDTSA